MIESEFKVMLTEEQYEKIRAMYQWDREIEQTNYYYDTEDISLISSHITCRVRRIDGVHYLQMKLPTGVEYSRVEREQELGSELPDTLSSQMLCSLSGRNDMPEVQLLGGLTTFRSVKRFDGAEIDLDKSSYFGKTDHEREIVFTDEAMARILLAEISQAASLVPDGDVCLGKVHRFLKEYMNK